MNDTFKKRTEYKRIILGLMVVSMTLQALGAYSTDRNKYLFWPLWGTDENGGHVYLTEPFGPRNLVEGNKYSSSTQNWFHTGLDIGSTGYVKNPYTGNGANGGKAYIFDYGGTNQDAMWVITRQWDGVHEVAQTMNWHVTTTGVTNGQTVNEGGQFTFQVKVPNTTWGVHLHFECYTNQDITNLATAAVRNIYTRDPLYWLYYPRNGNYNSTTGFLFLNKETNQYYAHNSSGTFDVVNNPNLNSYDRIIEFDLGEDYVMVRVQQKKPGIDISNIEVMAKDRVPSSYFLGKYKFDLTNRLWSMSNNNADLLLDLGNQSAERMNGVWYKNNRIASAYWHSGTIGEKKDVEYYVKTWSTIQSGQMFSIKINDIYGNGVTISNLQKATCVGCNPPSTVPPPPTQLTATNTSNGIHLEWNAVYQSGTQIGYKIYRRPTNTPNISYAEPIAYVTTTTYDDNLSTAGNGAKILPGVQYSYSIATLNVNGEGCNGPFVSNCNWQTNGCSSCTVREATAYMPVVQNFNFMQQTINGNAGNIQATGTLTLKDVYIGENSIATFRGNTININEEFTIQNGANVNFQTP